ncbi:hypothetical protein AA0119_g5224 [Alternaria tenuissima]|uniref:Uncharacterized protein n=3 Tax=Alternaria sect. Alternaria TaxID=2499237 RepID=A0A4Q4NM32_ALTAL|nr:hypothetical protein AG0111_0g11510 [Alternaria gaisen]RYN21943.1 hypothetical protein AA0115_g9404 [Alternaria tenuissima]RYN79073.1 hypothetical protein AA0117_g4082 [Alternaria alternata]RYN55375.1 hypothetical protein AA0118_g8830 [Alternaria tenuissima]RYN58180.1 hypothetical protein AA0114_g2193 [Alternaria tenuissima]
MGGQASTLANLSRALITAGMHGRPTRVANTPADQPGLCSRLGAPIGRATCTGQAADWCAEIDQCETTSLLFHTPSDT